MCRTHSEGEQTYFNYDQKMMSNSAHTKKKDKNDRS